MDTFLLTSQIVCYGVSIVSASFNIARFVRHRRSRSRRGLGWRLSSVRTALANPLDQG